MERSPSEWRDTDNQNAPATRPSQSRHKPASQTQTKSAYLTQTHIRFWYFRKILVYFSFWGELSSFTFLNDVQFLSRFGSVVTLQARQTEGGGRTPATRYKRVRLFFFLGF